MFESFDDALLKPTLTEADDALDFAEPWNPWSLVVLTFFFGLPAGGGLLALTSPPLGMRPRLAPALTAVIAATALMTAARLWMAAHGMPGSGDGEGDTLARQGWRAAACLL